MTPIAFFHVAVAFPIIDGGLRMGGVILSRRLSP